MFSSYKVVNSSSGRGTFEAPSRFANLACSRASLALSPHCRSRSARAVRPASLAASARYSACRQSPIKVGALCNQAWAYHASKTTGFGHTGFGRSSSVWRHFIQLPVSQRLKPQCSVMPMLPNTKPSVAPTKVATVQPWRLAMGVSPSKPKRQVVQQPPNPSFKRTRLWRSA